MIGLCGGSGVGKGFVGSMLSSRGSSVIDTDAVYHDLVAQRSECLDELTLAFGNEILTDSGALDRVALAAIVFSDPEKHKLLNRISHKHVLNKVRKMIADIGARGGRYVIVDAPMLFESGFDKECDVTVGVVASDKTRIQRIMRRDGISFERAVARISAQMPCDKIADMCDFVINNDGDENALSVQIEDLACKILN